MVAVRTDEEVWQRRGAYRGPEPALFFAPTVAEPRRERATREAREKKICADCGVRPECLDYALASREPHGIWGGYNEAEHRGMLDAREAG